MNGLQDRKILKSGDGFRVEKLVLGEQRVFEGCSRPKHLQV